MPEPIETESSYDVLIVGGGPGGLAAALTLGRARKRVLLCDAGPPRNAAAVHVHNFVTRDGTPPAEFRRIGREQLAPYESVEVREARVASISGDRGSFRIAVDGRVVSARRLLLCTGMIDEVPGLEGFSELWGHAIFQCPYCHGWEVQDQAWGYLAKPGDEQKLLPFALMASGWTSDLVVLTGGKVQVPEEARAALRAAGIRLETDAVKRLVPHGRQLAGIELSNGKTVPCDVLFTHPHQHQVPVVESLDLELDEHGFVAVEPLKGETSRPGVYAAGDLTTAMQGAVLAAAAGARTAAMINIDLAMDLVVGGAR